MSNRKDNPQELTDNRYLAIIPARGGSKRIPRKNIAFLAGKPLIAHTIEAALASVKLSEVVVSTDDEEIAKTAVEWGAKVPVLRPKNLAEDTSAPVDALLHMVRHVEQRGENVDAVVLLQPTSPFRTGTHIDEAVNLFESTGADTVTAVCQAREHPYYTWTMQEGCLKPFFSMEHQMLPRQSLPAALVENGAIYIIKRALLDRGTLYGNKIIPYLMEWETSVDIDMPQDLVWAEYLISKRV